MTNDPIKLRLRLTEAVYCSIRHTVRPESREQVSNFQEALQSLSLTAITPFSDSRMIELETYEPAKIADAARDVCSVYQIPPKQELPNVVPTDFMP